MNEDNMGCVCVCIYTSILHACVVCVYIYIYMCVCIYIYIHIYTHTYINIHTQACRMEHYSTIKKVGNPIGCNKVDESGINYVK